MTVNIWSIKKKKKKKGRFFFSPLFFFPSQQKMFKCSSLQIRLSSISHVVWHSESVIWNTTLKLSNGALSTTKGMLLTLNVPHYITFSCFNSRHGWLDNDELSLKSSHYIFLYLIAVAMETWMTDCLTTMVYFHHSSKFESNFLSEWLQVYGTKLCFLTNGNFCCWHNVSSSRNVSFEEKINKSRFSGYTKYGLQNLTG